MAMLVTLCLGAMYEGFYLVDESLGVLTRERIFQVGLSQDSPTGIVDLPTDSC